MSYSVSGRSDSFAARYYASQLGRFLTPDWSPSPEPIPYANLQNPQSLNLYSYVLNNPASEVDPDGHICCFGWLPSAYRWVSGILDGFAGTPSNSETPPAGNCGNPCVVNSTAMRVPLAETRALAVGMALAWGRIAPRPLTQAELQSLARQPVLGASPFMPPEGELGEILDEAANSGAENPALIRAIRDLFRAGDTVPGGTAGAVRKELSTGLMTEGKFHAGKAINSINRLRNLLNSGSLNENDANIARALINDLQNALGGH